MKTEATTAGFRIMPLTQPFMSSILANEPGAQETVVNHAKRIVRKFICESFLFDADADFSDETSFLDEGIIDSTGLLELVVFIEKKFAITIEDDELVPENLDTVSNIHNFILRKGGSL